MSGPAQRAQSTGPAPAIGAGDSLDPGPPGDMASSSWPAAARAARRGIGNDLQHFDLQAHRGGSGLVVESTLAGFANALELGVSTLELDVQITSDRHVVVSHDRQISETVCRDTGPAFPGDPAYPYVGKYIAELTLDQIRTLDCGSQTKPEHPQQRPVPGARMALLSEVFDLVEHYHAEQVRFNIETKVHASAPEETAPREEFVQAVAVEVRKAEMLDRVSIQSFDWGALLLMRQIEPGLPLVALTNGDFLQPGKPGISAWLDDFDADDFEGDLIAAVGFFGADAISPVHGMPADKRITDPDYEPFTTPELVKHAHHAGLAVIPWTVNDKPTMESLLDAGVDGLITDYPDRLRELMAERDLSLPRPYPAPSA